MARQHHENVVSNLDIGIRFYESLVTTDGYVPFHWHSSLEVICVLEGQLTFQVNGTRHVVHPNQFIVISSGVVHDVANTPNHAFVLQIPLPFVEKYYPHPEALNFTTAGREESVAYQQILGWFRQLNQINQQQLPGYRFDSGVILLSMLKTLILDFTDGTQPVMTNTSNLKDLIIYMNDHYSEKLTVSDLAHQFGYNPSYLSRVFKQQVGVTLVDYMYLIRLTNFYQDLVNTTIPINQLFTKHGLTNHRTAREVCRKMYGLLPKQIRLRAQKNE